jgi:hypothetical protein
MKSPNRARSRWPASRGEEANCKLAQNSWLNTQWRDAERIIAAGKVSTQPSAILRSVDICRPEPFAAMAPATPDESTCVVETGRP